MKQCKFCKKYHLTDYQLKVLKLIGKDNYSDSVILSKVLKCKINATNMILAKLHGLGLLSRIERKQDSGGISYTYHITYYGEEYLG